MAEVSESHKERDSIMRVDGHEAIEIAMYKEGDANTVAVAAAIDERMAEIAEELPANYERGQDLRPGGVHLRGHRLRCRSAAIIGAIVRRSSSCTSSSRTCAAR